MMHVCSARCHIPNGYRPWRLCFKEVYTSTFSFPLCKPHRLLITMPAHSPDPLITAKFLSTKVSSHASTSAHISQALLAVAAQRTGYTLPQNLHPPAVVGGSGGGHVVTAVGTDWAPVNWGEMLDAKTEERQLQVGF